jgi:class 3 adenylate cyclase
MREEPVQAATAETRKLAAIMFTDMVGFSRQMSADEARMLRVLTVHNQIIEQSVAEHYGHVIKTVGEHFWARGYAVSTVGFELESVKKYIREQEKTDKEGRF